MTFWLWSFRWRGVCVWGSCSCISCFLPVNIMCASKICFSLICAAVHGRRRRNQFSFSNLPPFVFRRCDGFVCCKHIVRCQVFSTEQVCYCTAFSLFKLQWIFHLLAEPMRDRLDVKMKIFKTKWLRIAMNYSAHRIILGYGVENNV